MNEIQIVEKSLECLFLIHIPSSILNGEFKFKLKEINIECFIFIIGKGQG